MNSSGPLMRRLGTLSCLHQCLRTGRGRPNQTTDGPCLCLSHPCRRSVSSPASPRVAFVVRCHRNRTAKHLQRTAIPVLDDIVQRGQAGVDEGTQILANLFASSARQSKPLPNVLSSISFENASSHFGGSVFVMIRVGASFSSCIRFVICSS